MPISLIIADDHGVVRQGLHSLMTHSSHADIEVLAEAEDGYQAVSLADKLRPDIVLLDVSMPVLNGIDAAKMICKYQPGTKVIGLSIHKHLTYVQHMFQAGARGYILKESAFEDILDAIRTVLEGHYYLSKKLNVTVKEIFREIGTPTPRSTGTEVLSARERHILQLIAEGKGTKDIAKLLTRSIKTVESHRKHIMDKLDIHSVAGLTAYAIREGIIQLDP